MKSDVLKGVQELIGVSLVAQLNPLQTGKLFPVKDGPGGPPTVVKSLDYPQNHRVRAEERPSDRFPVVRENSPATDAADRCSGKCSPEDHEEGVIQPD